MEIYGEFRNKNSINQLFHVEGDVWLVPCLATYTTNKFKPLARPSNVNRIESSAAPNHWTLAEDEILENIVQVRGAKSWNLISNELNSLIHQGNKVRNSKTCRERWRNHLNPELVKGKWSVKEDKLILDQFNIFGSQWSKISKKMKGRTENSVKNRYHYLMKRLANDPRTESNLDTLGAFREKNADLDTEKIFNGNSEQSLKYDKGVVIRLISDKVAEREKIRSARQRLKREDSVSETTPSPSFFLCKD